MVRPIGYIEVRDDGATFRPLRDPRLTALGAAAAGAAVAAVLLRGRRP
jgi:hypothetical protein